MSARRWTISDAATTPRRSAPASASSNSKHLFNFRSNVDVFLVAALVKDNWTGIATKEMGSSRVFGQLGKLLDVALVDREHPGTAAVLRPLEAAARNGLSILIAPEGARLDTESVGPFNPGRTRHGGMPRSYAVR